MPDEQAELILDHLYPFADVVVEAFIERPSRPALVPTTDGVAVAASLEQTLTSPLVA